MAENEMRSPPRTDLIRMSRGVPGIKNGRTLHGLVVAYNAPAEVRSWEGHFIEQIMPGAATKTISESSQRMKVLFNHGMDPSIGEKPLGRPTVIEERSDGPNSGVYAEVPVAETSYGDDILALVDAGAIDGWSFRFSVPEKRENWRRPAVRGQLPERDVLEMRMPEFGPVTFPVYEASTIGIRSHRDLSIWQQLTHEQRRDFRKMLALGTSFGDAVDEIRDALDDLGDVTVTVDTSASDAASEETDAPEDDESLHPSGPQLVERQAYVRRMKADALLEGTSYARGRN